VSTIGVQVSHIFGGELGHARAAVGNVFDHPFSRQLLERFPDGHRAHAQLLGDLPLAQPLTRLEIAVQDGSPQPFSDQVMELSVIDNAIHAVRVLPVFDIRCSI
jgi:hypothetical protein